MTCTNPALQELRGQGLMAFDRGRLTVLDWDRLVETGEFNPRYLHFDLKAKTSTQVL